ncbi:hypothetical protein B296_00048018 [Ensete ventricosum]|uniref:B box-type domain-containing protein n=1 Tax=Ensete ventricosum TaxID=4639 RepID=A0A426XKH4_ENSVE|nr:hypothetical protein B296_00048018 [Ensete ventricosum]
MRDEAKGEEKEDDVDANALHMRRHHSTTALMLIQMQSDERATIYCESGTTFLCWACNASVHGANFLMAYHVRQVTCITCHSLKFGCRVFGVGP